MTFLGRKLEPFALVVRKRGGGERTIPPERFFFNRNTPVGDDAEIWEIMPHRGRREIPWSDVIRREPIARIEAGADETRNAAQPEGREPEKAPISTGKESDQ